MAALNILAALLDIPVSLYLLLSGATAIFAFAYVLFLIKQRSNDISGRYTIWYVLCGIVLFPVLGILPGQNQPNAYGSTPAKSADFKAIKYIRKYPIYAVIALAVVASLLFSAVAGRGWIRGTALPVYANKVYKPKLEKTFRHDYPDIRNQLLAYDLKLPTLSSDRSAASCDKLTNDESTLTFSGFRESVSCNWTVESKVVSLNEAYINKWKQQAPMLDAYLRSQGYKKDHDSSSSDAAIGSILNLNTQDQETMISYTKSHGNTYCIVQFYSANYNYGAHSATEAPTFYVTYQCDNGFNLFGGYSYYG